MTSILQVNKKDLYQTQIIENNNPDFGDIKDGQVLAKIQSLAMTANNITYGVVGEQVGYWQFYPIDDTWGIIPAWGFAEIIASKNSEVKEGTRIYGFFPMGTHVILEAGQFRKNGFADIAEHRSHLAAVYNFYIDIAKDQSFQFGNEATQMIFRPLFTTSFLIDYFLNKNNFFDSENIILTSASSKTGFSLAFLIQESKKLHNLNFNVIGLTSEKNISFVESLGFYDKVLPYDNLDKVSQKPTTIVDFSGNQKLLIDLQKYLGDNHQNTTMVGLSHWDATQGERAKGSFFFAPDWVKQVNEEWGFEKFQMEMGKKWLAFIQKTQKLINFTELNGITELQKVYLELLKGDFSPANGYIVKFG